MRNKDIHTGNPRRFGNKAEADIQKRGYALTPNSGAGGTKGDLRKGDFMVEVKATKFDSYSLKEETMAKLRNDGMVNGKTGVLYVTLGSGRTYAVVPLNVFEGLMDGHQV